MGKMIEGILLERGHKVVSIIDEANPQDVYSEAFRSADVAIEFTRPEAAVDDILHCFSAGVPVVSGTTGWTDSSPKSARCAPAARALSSGAPTSPSV